MELQDQRVLVTGATAGIGQETAKLFARRGASVIITGRDTERGELTVAAIEAEGGRAEFIAADLTDIESVRRLAEQAGDVDVLVNNAGAHTAGPTLEQDVEVRRRRARTVLPDRGAAAQDDRPRIGCDRQYLRGGRFGRRRRRARPTRSDSAVDLFGDFLEQLGSATPLGRTADPSEIAETIVFLASPQASYLTGATVAVDGGYTAI